MLKLKRSCCPIFYKADADYGTRLAKAVGVDLKMVQAKAAQLKDE